MRLGRKCTLDEIEVGEVFARLGCFEILVKASNGAIVFLADDWRTKWSGLDKPNEVSYSMLGTFYKLPQSVQQLWRQDE